jgi:hypothetical protein
MNRVNGIPLGGGKKVGGITYKYIEKKNNYQLNTVTKYRRKRKQI